MKEIVSEKYAQPMGKELIIMRGVSGSGKSWKARELLRGYSSGDNPLNHPVGNGVICSADDFFTERGKGEYAFDPSLLPVAHKQCQDKAVQALKKGLSPVIIDNTNTKLWELKQLKPIILLAQSLGYKVRIEEPDTEWWKRKDVEEMWRRNSHGVPREAIERMVNRFHPNVTVDDILNDNEEGKQ